MRGSVSICLYKFRQIEKTCINFFEESGLNATLTFKGHPHLAILPAILLATVADPSKFPATRSKIAGNTGIHT